MIVYFDLKTKEITRTENNTNIPVLPYNLSYAEKEEFYMKNNEYFLITEELGSDIFKYDVIHNAEKNIFELRLKGEL